MSPQDQIVAVMGPTGAGKSTFIEYATRQAGQAVGHGLRSFTTEIRATSVLHPNRPLSIVFVDTPGFDHTEKTDIEVLVMIADWLVKTYRDGAKLVAIVYLHRISENRMVGSLLKNLQIFTSMCGRKAMPNVIIATTMWGEVNQDVGNRREEELKGEFWNQMLADGCRTMRFEDSYESAWKIVDDLIEKSIARVQLSTEIVESNLRLNETKAAIALNNELQKLVKEQKEATRRLEEQAQRQSDKELLKQFYGRKEEIQAKIRQTEDQLRRLKVPGLWARQLGNLHDSLKVNPFRTLRSSPSVDSLATYAV